MAVLALVNVYAASLEGDAVPGRAVAEVASGDVHTLLVLLAGMLSICTFVHV